MHPDLQLAMHRADMRELERELDLRRSMQECPRFILQARPHLRGIIQRARALLKGSRASMPSACCAA